VRRSEISNSSASCGNKKEERLHEYLPALLGQTSKGGATHRLVQNTSSEGIRKACTRKYNGIEERPGIGDTI